MNKNNALQSIDWQTVKEKRKQMMIDEKNIDVKKLVAETKAAIQRLESGFTAKADIEKAIEAMTLSTATWQTIPSDLVLERIEKAISLIDAHKFYFEALGYSIERINELLEALQIAKRTCEFAQVTDFVKP